jgi:hypothetical protein
VGSALTDITAATLEAGLAVATAGIEAERRSPMPARIAIVAMGRFGGYELSYGSDADVMFVFEPTDEETARDSGQDVTRVAHDVANELRRLLALPGTDPALDVDTGLRPEGKQGPLVRSLDSYAAYYAKWSRVWEAQALLRASAIIGDPDLSRRFTELIDPLRFPEAGISEDDIREIRRIKARVDAERLPRGADPSTHLKLGRGGLADVEWTIQLLQIRYGAGVPGPSRRSRRRSRPTCSRSPTRRRCPRPGGRRAGCATRSLRSGAGRRTRCPATPASGLPSRTSVATPRGSPTSSSTTTFAPHVWPARSSSGCSGADRRTGAAKDSTAGFHAPFRF